MISGKAPSLSDVIERMQHDGESLCCLDGTLIRPDWVASRDPDTGDLLWCSGKHTACGANVQILTGHTGHQVRISPVEPGSAHDATPFQYCPRLQPMGYSPWPTRAAQGRVSALATPSRATIPALITSPTTLSRLVYTPPPKEPRPHSKASRS